MAADTCPAGYHVWTFIDGWVRRHAPCFCGGATWPNDDLPQKFAPSPTARPRIEAD